MRYMKLSIPILSMLAVAACGASPPSASRGASAAAETPEPAAHAAERQPAPSSRYPIKAQPEIPPPREGPAMSDFSITMRRGACFGRCPQYTVTVNGAGQVDFFGKRFVGASGTHTHRADMDQLAPLLQQTQAVFASIQDVVPGAASCRRHTTDMPQITLTLEDANGTRTLRHYTGCADAPAALLALEQQIDATANVTEWVSGRATE